MILSEFYFEVQYRAGRLNGKADSISRRPDYEIESDKENLTRMLDPYQFVDLNSILFELPAGETIRSSELNMDFDPETDWPLVIAHYLLSNTNEWLIGTPDHILKKCQDQAGRFKLNGDSLFRILDDGISTVPYVSMSKRIEEINRLQGKTGEFAQKARNRGSTATNFLNEFFESLLRLLRQIVAFMGKSLGIFFLGLGSVLLLVWLSIVLSGGYGINISTNDEVSNFSINTFLSAFFSDPNYLKIFLIGLAMFTIAPIISLLLFGLRLITRKGLLSGWPATVNGTVFTIGLILMVVTAALMLTEFKSKGKIIEPIGLVQPPMSDTLEIKILQGKVTRHRFYII
jgi:hypothetical protein